MKRQPKTSGEDGGVGRHCASSHNQKKGNNNLKTKNNQNRQKIELYGSPTTKEIKKKHSSRLVRGAEMGSQVERTPSKAGAGGPSEVADCGVGWAKLQLASEAAAGGPAATDRATQSSSSGK